MEIEPYGEGHKVVFSEKEEILPVGVGLIILENFRNDRAEISAHRELMQFHGRDLSPFHPAYEIDTTKPHEKALLEGLMWVAQQKERLSAEIFELNMLAMGIEQAFDSIGKIGLGDYFSQLTELIDQLQDEGVIEYSAD